MISLTRFSSDEIGLYYYYLNEKIFDYKISPHDLEEHFVNHGLKGSFDGLKEDFLSLFDEEGLFREKFGEGFIRSFEKELKQKLNNEYFSLGTSQKSKWIREQLNEELKETFFLNLATFVLDKGGCTNSRIRSLYKEGREMGLSEQRVSELLRPIAENQDEVIRLVTDLNDSSKIYSFLYSLKAFYQSSGRIDSKEKETLKKLRDTFGLEVGFASFWLNFIHILEGNNHKLDYINDEDEILGVLAGVMLVVFADKSMHEIENAIFHKWIKQYNLSKEALSKLKEYNGKSIDEIINPLSNKAKLLLLVKGMSIILADKDLHDDELALLETVYNSIDVKGSSVEEDFSGEELYLLFLYYVFTFKSSVLVNGKGFIVKMNRDLKHKLNINRDMQKVLFLMESFLNVKGISFSKAELLNIFSAFDLIGEDAESLALDCIHEDSENEHRAKMLLAYLKANVYLDDNDSTVTFKLDLIKSLSLFPAPQTYEKKAIVFYILKSILFDKKIDSEEASFFDDIAYEMRVDDGHTYRFISYLYLATSIHFQYGGYLNYEEMIEEKTKYLKKLRFRKLEADSY